MEFGPKDQVRCDGNDFDDPLFRDCEQTSYICYSLQPGVTIASFIESAGNMRVTSVTLARSGRGTLGYSIAGLARLVYRHSSNSLARDALVKFTGEFRGLRGPGQWLCAVGLVVDARQMSKAIGKSVKSRNMRPAAAQATRSLANWSAVWAGAELFGTGGALLGVAAGPGAVVTSGVGALLGGYVGLFASEWIARRIDLAN